MTGGQKVSAGGAACSFYCVGAFSEPLWAGDGDVFTFALVALMFVCGVVNLRGVAKLGGDS